MRDTDFALVEREAELDEPVELVDIPELARALRTTRSGRRLLALNSPAFFGVYYLDLEYATHQKRWMDRIHGLAPGGRLLLLAPRAHGKTESIVSVITQLIAEDRDVRILLICKTASLAKKRLRRVKMALEGNRKLHKDYGTFKPAGLPSYLVGVLSQETERGPKVQVGYWTESYIYVDRPSNRTDPTLEATGWRGAITGGRFDWVFFDDPIDGLSAQSETEREKGNEWLYDSALELLEPTGRAVSIGTRKHFADMYATMMDDPSFDVIHDKAIMKWPTFSPVYETEPETGRDRLARIDVTGECRVLWEHKWPIRALLRKFISARSTVGSRVWLRENQNEISDDTTAAFPMTFFRGGPWQPSPSVPEIQLPGCFDVNRSWADAPSYTVDELPGLLRIEPSPKLSDLLVIQSWDLGLVANEATAESHDTDYTVGKTFIVDKRTWTRYAVAMYRDRGITPFAVLGAVAREYARFGGGSSPELQIRIVIESVLFQALYTLILRAKTDLPVLGHATDRRKADPATGLPHLSALCEGGKIRWPYATRADRDRSDAIAAEWHSYPRGKHDDTLLATYVGESRILLVESAATRTERLKGKPSEQLTDAPPVAARPSRRV